MAKVEILFYSPIDLEKFIDFCILGEETDKNVAAKDKDGNHVLGVINWLIGWGAQEAHFFHTPIPEKPTAENPNPKNPWTFFMALVRKREGDNKERPWFITDLSAPPRIILDPDIPGIDKLLSVDGELGMLPDFLPIGELLAQVTNDPDLDAAFVAKKKRVQPVLKQLEQDPEGTERFLAALRGERESKPEEVFKKLNFSLRD
jgi:hypothetical protein